jgi:hypothetical protein
MSCLNKAAIDLAVHISVTVGMLGAPLTSILLLLCCSHFFGVSIDKSIWVICGAVATTWFFIPFIASKYLRRWTDQNMPIIPNALTLGMMVGAVFALPLLAFGWQSFWTGFLMSVLYAIWISSLYVFSLSNIKKKFS